MDVLWQAPSPLSVRDVREALGIERTYAYTTVMTVLDRLYGKEQVLRERVPGGSAWHYRSLTTKAEQIAAELHQVLDTAGAERNVVLAQFLEGLEEPQVQHLERLLAAKASARS